MWSVGQNEASRIDSQERSVLDEHTRWFDGSSVGPQPLQCCGPNLCV